MQIFKDTGINFIEEVLKQIPFVGNFIGFVFNIYKKI
jgi:hypothetical protein